MGRFDRIGTTKARRRSIFFFFFFFLCHLIDVINSKVIMGYLPSKTYGDVHILGSFRSAYRGKNLRVSAEILTHDNNWNVVLLNGNEVLKRVSTLQQCNCQCVRDTKVDENAVRPDADGIYRWSASSTNIDGVAVVALATCEGENDDNRTNGEPNKRQRIHSGEGIIEYAVTFINGDGSHVAAEESGRRGGQLLLLILWEAAASAFFYTWWSQHRQYGSFGTESHRLLMLFSVAVGLKSLQLGCEASHLNAYGADGFGYPIMHFLAMLFGTMSHSCFVVLLVAVPSTFVAREGKSAYDVAAEDWNDRNSGDDVEGRLNNILRHVSNVGGSRTDRVRTLAMIIAAYAFTSLWASYEIDERRRSQVASTANGWEKFSTLLAALFEAILFLAFLQRALRARSSAATEPGVYAFFSRFAVAFVPLFAMSAIRLATSGLFLPWSDLARFVDAMYALITFASYVGMGWILWPVSSNWLLSSRSPKTSRVDTNPFASILSVSVKSSSRAVRSTRDGAYDEIPSSVAGDDFHLESF